MSVFPMNPRTPESLGDFRYANRCDLQTYACDTLAEIAGNLWDQGQAGKPGGGLKGRLWPLSAATR